MKHSTEYGIVNDLLNDMELRIKHSRIMICVWCTQYYGTPYKALNNTGLRMKHSTEYGIVNDLLNDMELRIKHSRIMICVWCTQ